jgi:hypothetical protein
MSTPRYVEHDGQRWSVDAEIDVDDQLGYELSRRVPARNGNVARLQVIVARASECVPLAAPERVRKFRDGRIVLEMNSRGQVYVRKHGSRKRYETSLEAIFSMTVKARVAMDKALKAAARRKGKR